MKKLVKLMMLGGIAISIFFSCKQKNISTNDSAKDNPEVKENTMTNTISEGNNKFAIDLMSKLSFGKQNTIISPYSINTALAMTYAGSRGETMIEMATVMHYTLNQEIFHPEFKSFSGYINSLSSSKAGFENANAIYAQKDYDFLKEFFNVVEKNYGSVLKFVDFHKGDREAIRLEINNWVEEKTHSKIKDLIVKKILNEDTRMVLVNAIYFLAEWEKEFKKDLTYDGVFNISISGKPEGKVTSSFMTTTDSFTYFKDSECAAIELPYSDNKFSMLVILPSIDSNLEVFLKKLTYTKLMAIVYGLNKQQVELHLPKFKIETETELSDLLSGMGMPLAFSNKADFSGMTGKYDLKIDKVIHKAFVEVDEKGTEAAAATAVVMIRKTTAIEAPEKTIFRADRPFLFFIQDTEKNSIIFMGSVVNPTK
jgi:serpin B